LKIVEDTLRVMEIKKQENEKTPEGTKEGKNNQNYPDTLSSQMNNEDLMIQENEYQPEEEESVSE